MSPEIPCQHLTEAPDLLLPRDARFNVQNGNINSVFNKQLVYTTRVALFCGTEAVEIIGHLASTVWVQIVSVKALPRKHSTFNNNS
jgi:hypothetical protein